MLTERASGILVHPTSFPTRFGIGDLGPSADEFLEWLAAAGQRCWQVLPLCPADAGGSPYQSASSFAGNPLLISPELLARDGLLTEAELNEAAVPESEFALRVDFQQASTRKRRLLERAAQRLRDLPATHPLHGELLQFVNQHRDWLEGHAQFMAASEANGGASWPTWSIAATQVPFTIPPELSDRVAVHLTLQFFFFRQWQRLRDRARQLGIQIIGDIPIYVSYDSADVWANRSLFQLDERGRSTRVAGVPPDYFAATGQLWNNPLYDWAAMERDGYRWWIHRLRASLQLVDFVRLDHFRGFEAFWSVAAGEPTAMNGEWVPGPKDSLLTSLRTGLERDRDGMRGSVDSRQPLPTNDLNDSLDRGLPIIAEDLGMITEEVHALRRRHKLPGMKVLQFMLPGEAWDNTRVEDFEPNSVVYTGTHDNDTSLGWFRADVLPHHEKLDRLRRYVPCDESRFAWEFIEFAWRSGSNIAIAPLQDVFSLDSSARMNKPGTSGNTTTNWQWRYSPGMLTDDLKVRVAELTRTSGR